MAQETGSKDVESCRIELSETSIFRSYSDTCSVNNHEEGDENLLQWAEIDRLPTFERLRSSLFDEENGDGDAVKGKKVVDVTKLIASERHMFMEKLIKHIENDNLQLLQKLRKRTDNVGIQLPSVEVRYKNLCVEAECEVVHGKPLPTLWNSFHSMLSDIVPGLKSKWAKRTIINDITGVIKPGRMTLLLGPPGCGKTTLLKALSGNLNKSLKISGEVSYNGYKIEEFVPQKTSAYISQDDLHIPQMTVRETLDFSSRCQGTKSRADIMAEVNRREKEEGIIPDPDIDTFMKAISIEGQNTTLQTNYILKILGLDICADTTSGDAMNRGISGGQKKRLTTGCFPGEMIVGPKKALFMDEISNGLDSSTTYQTIACLQQFAHLTDASVLISLLQPSPEAFDLFDDVILMEKGMIVYHGPRSDVLDYFEGLGFKCPERKGVADFLQEVVSRKDQENYWYRTEQQYNYVPVHTLSTIFKESYLGKELEQIISKLFTRSHNHENAISFNVYSISRWDMFRACMSREILLMKRNSFVYIFKFTQLLILAVMTMTVFLRTRLKVDVIDANYYLGSLFFALLVLVVDGYPELSMTVARLPVFYKQRDMYFYPAWAYAIPASILKIPLSMFVAIIWTCLTYYVIGYSPEPGRFFRQAVLLFGMHFVSISMFRFIASLFQTLVASITAGSLSMLFVLSFGGFILPHKSMPAWLKWVFWVCPQSYGQIGIAVNEFHSPRWNQVLPPGSDIIRDALRVNIHVQIHCIIISNSGCFYHCWQFIDVVCVIFWWLHITPQWNQMVTTNTTIGMQTLQSHGLDFDGYYFWISLGALFGFSLLFNMGFIMALTYLKAPQTRTIISKERLSQLNESEAHHAKDKPTKSLFTSMQPCDQGKIVLPFEPLTITFQELHYHVEPPPEMKEHGFTVKRLQLLNAITGAFRPGVLTTLMGVSGAGKTTLLDVLAGRKTSGIVEGEIKISGYPKVQDTFARISGYCEQTDVHSPQITVEESVIYSAWLRLHSEIDSKTKYKFVEEILQTVELYAQKDALVGIPGVRGLSTEQRKRLTIAVEVVANPSIIFMDEPTTGLDARSAAIVMRAVKNIVDTGRTIVCTIHQPSIDIFEAFDELILLKNGGRVIYSGPLGRHSSRLIEYFESISGVPKIRDNYNPATWMLEVTSSSMESELGVDFGEIYSTSTLHAFCYYSEITKLSISGVPKIRDNYNPATWMLEVTSSSMESELGVDFGEIYSTSTLHASTKELVEKLSKPHPGSKDLYFPTRFPQNGWGQFKACLWKQHLSYWRSPSYNLVRIFYMLCLSFTFGLLFWGQGKKIHNQQSLFNVLGSMFAAVLFGGIKNCSSVMPYVSMERTVLYRERFSGMYASLAYAFAQVMIEFPYLFVQSLVYTCITYPMIGYHWSAYKVFYYFYTFLCTLMYYNYLGMLLVAMTPSFPVAAVLQSAFYATFNLFGGFLIPKPKIPNWWIWLYYMTPTSWTLNALLTSQFGDMKKEILVFGENKSVEIFLREYFGYHHEQLPLAFVLLALYPIIFASLFACCIAKLNFQRR
ncbi:pleiotropic drug resistance protein 3 [Artemisia annua]|uniref:Pleiotropic drug resistance protein 3 n=1 Tax=Artemisia annua TaxID=35608 RepID=A0A2U1P3A3_ARTAN|nr:pleiotropic drug resistance protein 3 [Artemisia annua]